MKVYVEGQWCFRIGELHAGGIGERQRVGHVGRSEHFDSGRARTHGKAHPTRCIGGERGEGGHGCGLRTTRVRQSDLLVRNANPIGVPQSHRDRGNRNAVCEDRGRGSRHGGHGVVHRAGDRRGRILNLESVNAVAISIIRTIEQGPRCACENNVAASISLNIFKQHVVVALHKSRVVDWIASGISELVGS